MTNDEWVEREYVHPNLAEWEVADSGAGLGRLVDVRCTIRRENNRFLWRLGIGTFALVAVASFVLSFVAVMWASR